MQTKNKIKKILTTLLSVLVPIFVVSGIALAITTIGTNITTEGDLTVDTNTLYVDSVNNRVGIGTTGPGYKLDISASGIRGVSVSNGYDTVDTVYGVYAEAVNPNEEGQSVGVYGSGFYGVYAAGDYKGIYASGTGYGVLAAGGTYGVYAAGATYGVTSYNNSNGGYSLRAMQGNADGYAVYASGGKNCFAGNEAGDAVFILDADRGDDDTDSWKFMSRASDNDLAIFNHTSELVTIEKEGNVGIGTTSPGAKLDIEPGTGDAILVSGTLNQDNQKGLQMTVSSDTDGDTVYGIHNTLNTGTGTLSEDSRGAYGFYNNLTVAANYSGSRYPRAYGLYNLGTGSGEKTYLYGLYSRLTASGTDSYAYGSYNYVEATGTSSIAHGVYNDIRPEGSSTTGYGVRTQISANYDSLAQTLYGQHILVRTYDASDVGYGAYIADLMNTSLGGTQYGVYIDISDDDLNNQWGIYETGGATNYFSGNVGIGTTSPEEKLEVNGGIRLNTEDSKPTCNTDSRGTLWFTQGGAGVKDTLEVCAKDAGDTYAWRVLY